MKPCIRCGESKPISEFYVHKMMADGHLNKCKSCCRSDAIANRVRNLDRYRQYDRERFSTLRRRVSVEKQRISYRTRYPEKRAAHVATGSEGRRQQIAQFEASLSALRKELNLWWERTGGGMECCQSPQLLAVRSRVRESAELERGIQR